MPEVKAQKIPVAFTVNGVAYTVHAYPMARLLDVLREDLRLTGTKEGCGEGECGACSAFVDGRLVNTCLVPAIHAQGAVVTTIEGLADDGVLHAVQQSFIDDGGAQCGICTPGMILATVALLREHPEPDEVQIREGLAGNLCRCTGYMKIFDAVKSAARTLLAHEDAAPTPTTAAGGGQ